MWGYFRFYFTATSIVHNLATSSHATPIELTYIDDHLVQDPRQKTVVDLASRIPSLALDVTLLAPESPKTKYGGGFEKNKFPAIRRKVCYSGVHSTLPRFSGRKHPTRNALLVLRQPPQHPPQLVVQGKDSHAIL